VREIRTLRATRRVLETCLWEPDCGPRRKPWNFHRTLTMARQRSTLPHICSQTRNGRFTLRRKTIAKRRRAKLQAIKTELRRRMHASVPETGRWLRGVLQGYYHYFAVPYNLDALNQLRYEVGRAWLRLLRRRSQKARRHLTWEKFKGIQAKWLSIPRLYHPWPNVRFRRHHPRQEPCALCGYPAYVASVRRVLSVQRFG
jgi:hypothetical protein